MKKSRIEPTFSNSAGLGSRSRQAAIYEQFDERKLFGAKTKSKKGGLLALILMLLVGAKVFIFDFVNITDNQMQPNLYEGDYLLVNKLTYGLRLPFSNRLVYQTGDPKRGDIVLHNMPDKPDNHFIKRVIAIPGDNVEYDIVNRVLMINGKPLDKDILSNFDKKRKRYRQKLGKIEFDIIDTPFAPAKKDENWLKSETRLIPKDRYFVLSDNRSICCDSRNWGLIPIENMIGKVTANMANKGSSYDISFERAKLL